EGGPVMPEWRKVLSDERVRAHEIWFRDGCQGEGQLIVEGKNLANTRLQGCGFEYAKFIRCNLERAVIAYSGMSNVEIVDCDAPSAVFIYDKFPGALLTRTRFFHADFRLASLSRTQIESCDFTKGRLAQSHFVRAHVTHTTFRDAGIHDAQLDKGNFIGCDFR